MVFTVKMVLKYIFKYKFKYIPGGLLPANFLLLKSGENYQPFMYFIT